MSAASLSCVLRALGSALLIGCGFVARAQWEIPIPFTDDTATELPPPAEPGVAAAELPASGVYLLPSAADLITPELQALADSFGHDPAGTAVATRLYEWVRNSIDFTPYNGLKRGAHMTWLERAGNDFDQAALLVALLKAAGYTDVSYRFGKVWIPKERSDGNDAVHWVGADKGSVRLLLANLGVQYPNNLVTEDATRVLVPRVWVVLVVGGTTYVLDPAWKRYRSSTAVDLATAAGYSKDTMLAQAGGTLAGSKYTMGAVGSANLRAALTTASVALTTHAREQLHEKSGLELAGGQILEPEIISALPTALPAGFDRTGQAAAEIWSQVPASYLVRCDLVIGGIAQSFYTAELGGRKLAVWFNGTKAELWLDDTLVVSESGSPSGAAAGSIAFTYPSSTFSSSAKSFIALERSGGYSILYGFGRTLGRLHSRLKRAAEYVAEGKDPAQRQLRTESLDIVSLQYLAQKEVFDRVLGGVTDSVVTYQTAAGIVGLHGGAAWDNQPYLYTDIPLLTFSGWPRSPVPPGTTQTDKYYHLGRVSEYHGSVMEGVTVEQACLPGAISRGASTVSLLQASINAGHALFLAHSRADYNAFLPLLHGFPGKFLAGYDAYIAAKLDAGGKLLAPEYPTIPLGSAGYTGIGLVLSNAGDYGSTLWWMNGGIHGGNATTTGTPGAAQQVANADSAKTADTLTEPTAPQTFLGDPVDATNGAFHLAHTDLSLDDPAGAGAPHALALSRSYSVARRLRDPTGLGKGWTHSYDIRLAYRHPNDFDLERASAADVAPLMIALKTAYDVYARNGTAKQWAVPIVALAWAGEQLINSRAAVTVGEKTFEFTKLPDGSFAPPAGLAATLAGAPGNHTLTFRKGNTIAFARADGKFTAITDRRNSGATAYTLSATYRTDGKLDRVTDPASRYLQFTYNTAGRLTAVADSTGRSVSYGRETLTENGVPKNAFTFTDAEAKKSWLFHDSADRIYELRDARGRTVLTNTFDTADRAVAQRTFGDAARTWTNGYTGTVARQVDPLGRTSWYYFDARGRRWAAVDALGRATYQKFDGADRLASVTTPAGETTTFAYDRNHEPVSITNPAGDTRTIVPESDDSTTTDRTDNSFEGRSTVTQYHAFHRVKQVIAPGGITAEFQYDSRGRPSGVHPAAYAAGKEVSLAYSAVAGSFQRITATYPDGTTEVSDFDARGNLLRSLDRRGVQTTFAYNKRRQRTSVAVWAGGPYTAGSPFTGTPPTGSAVSQVFYDDAGDVDYALDPRGNRTEYDFNALGDPSSVAGSPGTDPVVSAAFAYNARNQLETTTDAQGFRSAHHYDAAGQLWKLVDPLHRVVEFGFDANGRRTSVKSPLGHITRETFDSRGLPTLVLDALNSAKADTDPDRKVIERGYDQDGVLTSLRNRRDQTYRFAFDAAARTQTSTTPLGKTTTVVRNTRGLIESFTEASGQKVEITAFDDEGRPLTQLVKRADGSVESTITSSYHANGLLWTVSEGGRTTTRTYDSLNRLMTYSDGEGHTIGYEYDPAGNLTTLTYPDGRQVHYTYDTYNRLKTVWEDWSGTIRTTTFAYDSCGRLVYLARPDGTIRQQVFDEAGQLRQIIERSAAGALFWYGAYRFDGDGRIDWRLTNPAPAPIELPTATATYDADNRLESWNNGGVANVVHDDDGNLTTGPGADGLATAFSFDARNRLISAAGTTHRYNPDGLRVETAGVDAATYTVDPGAGFSRVLTRTKDGTTTYYVWGVGLMYEVDGTTGATKTYHADHLGNTVALSDATGAVTDRMTYAPYGTLVARSGTTATPFLFGGVLGCQTDASGLVHMRARFYNPRTARFLNADPIGFAGGLNWYAYAGGNPIMRIDPSGLDWIDNSANFIVGMGDSLSFGITREIRDNISFYNGTVDYSAKSYFAGEVVETGIEIGLTLGAAALKKGATKAAAELGRSGLKAVRREAREVAEVAVRQTDEAGEKLFVHHSNPLIGHPGGAPALFPSLGVDAFRNSKLNLEVLRHAEHMTAHRTLRYQEQLLESLVMNPLLTGVRASRNIGSFFSDSSSEGSRK